MNRQEYSDHVTRRHQEAAELSARKSRAYTGDGDPFDSFTVSAAVAGTTPEKYIIGLMAMKLVRLRSLLESGTVDFESTGDTCLDISNYSLILDALLESKKNKHDTN